MKCLNRLTVFITFLIITVLINFFFLQIEKKVVFAHEKKQEIKKKMDSKGPFEQFFTKKKGEAPYFTLINQDGKKVSLKDFRGKVVVMTYIYTTCKVVCPLLEAKFMDLQKVYKKKLGKELILISLTMDSERDTPQVLKRHAEYLDANLNGWVFLTGTKKEIDKVLKSYDLYYKKLDDGEFDHVNRYTIIDRDGNYAYEINGLLPATDPLIWKLMEMLEGFG